MDKIREVRIANLQTRMSEFREMLKLSDSFGKTPETEKEREDYRIRYRKCRKEVEELRREK